MNHSVRNRTWLLCLVAAVGSGLAAAQDAAIQQLAGKASLSPDETNQVQSWVTTSVASLSGNDAIAATTTMRQMKVVIRGSTPAFREAYARAIVAEATPSIARVEAPAAARLLIAIGMAETADVAGTLTNALSDERPAIREAAAASLRRLKPKLALAAGDLPTRVITAVRDAAKKETVRYVLESMYQAANYAEDGDTNTKRAMMNELLDVLESRRDAYVKNEVAAPSADRVAVEAIGTQASQMDGAAKRRFGIVLGQMLRYAVQVYTQSLAPGEPPLADVTDKDSPELVQQRNGIERLIIAVEAELNKILGKDAERDVTKFMKDADPTQVKIAMDRWSQVLKNEYNQEFALQQINGG